MVIKKRVKLKNMYYYVSVDCVDKNDTLCLKDYKKDYFDGGDLSALIEEVEKNYHLEHSWFMPDVIYIYNNIPFISGVGDYYVDKEGMIYSTAYVTKKEIDKYMKENNIKRKDDTNFKLWDARTWDVR